MMPFGLKNAGATYQRTMQACLKKLIGQIVQVYVDDIVITTRTEDSLIDDLRKVFDALNKYQIKLNPDKCVFGVPAGELLGYLVSARGIEANPEKVQNILDMPAPTKLHRDDNVAHEFCRGYICTDMKLFHVLYSYLVDRKSVV